MIDILFVAFNRLEFTRKSFEAMIRNTDWNSVARTVIYDDGSTDGTIEFLRAASKSVPVPCELRTTRNVGPVAITNDYLKRGGTDLFAKIDNDVVLPPGWLGECLALMPATDLLGIEPMHPPALDGPRHAEPASHIGGIGIMRRRVFTDYPVANGRFGFTQWQTKHKNIRKAWIVPSLPVVLLNLVPFSPWKQLSDRYVARKLQRPWPAPRLMTTQTMWDWQK